LVLVYDDVATLVGRLQLNPDDCALIGGLRPPGGRPIPLLRAFLGQTSDIYWIFRQPAPADIHVRMEPRSASCLSLPTNLT
jgi:hypothetical protein